MPTLRSATASEGLRTRALLNTDSSSLLRHVLGAQVQYPWDVLGIYRVFVKARAPNPYETWIESNAHTSDQCNEERRLLWHGVPWSSLLGNMDRGLQIKKKAGGMFGNGI